jgi:hypothetical protein
VLDAPGEGKTPALSREEDGEGKAPDLSEEPLVSKINFGMTIELTSFPLKRIPCPNFMIPYTENMTKSPSSAHPINLFPSLTFFASPPRTPQTYSTIPQKNAISASERRRVDTAVTTFVLKEATRPPKVPNPALMSAEDGAAALTLRG